MRVRLSNFKPVKFSEPSLLPVADQQRRLQEQDKWLIIIPSMRTRFEKEYLHSISYTSYGLKVRTVLRRFLKMGTGFLSCFLFVCFFPARNRFHGRARHFDSMWQI